jgi:hypothetical protein
LRRTGATVPPTVPYRWIYIGLGLVAVAAIAFGVAFGGGGEELTLPDRLEGISPQPGDLVPQQTAIEVDLPVGYVARIYVDGWLVEDVTFVEGTGVYRWSPSPSSPSIPEWAPGGHTIRVEWDKLRGLPDPGQFEWSFRVG